MKRSFRRSKLLIVAAVLALLWLALFVFSSTAPVVYVHYAAAAHEPAIVFFNDDNDITKTLIDPGARLEFRTAHRQHARQIIDVSLPFASREGVEIRPPFSRVDVYIGVDNKITRTVINTYYLARLGMERVQ